MAIHKNNSATRFMALLIFVLILLPLSSDAQRRTPARSNASGAITKPKLVLVIVIDQFRYDYLERFGDLLGSGGFKRLLNDGALFSNANYDYVPTFTACGHAAIFSGSVPAQDGIVGNAFFDRESGRTRVMVSDDSAHLVTPAGLATKSGAASPRSLTGTTIGDQMRLATSFQSKVIAVSLEDRAAGLPRGLRPDGA